MEDNPDEGDPLEFSELLRKLKRKKSFAKPKSQRQRVNSIAVYNANDTSALLTQEQFYLADPNDKVPCSLQYSLMFVVGLASWW